jgi:hypothetical protein
LSRRGVQLMTWQLHLLIDIHKVEQYNGLELHTWSFEYCNNWNIILTNITYWFDFVNELLLICLQLTIFLDSRIYRFTRWQCCIRDRKTIIHNRVDSFLFQTWLSFKLARKICFHFIVGWRIKTWLLCLALSMDHTFRRLHTRGPIHSFVSSSVSHIVSRLSTARSKVFGYQGTKNTEPSWPCILKTVLSSTKRPQIQLPCVFYLVTPSVAAMATV